MIIMALEFILQGIHLMINAHIYLNIIMQIAQIRKIMQMQICGIFHKLVQDLLPTLDGTQDALTARFSIQAGLGMVLKAATNFIVFQEETVCK